MKDTISIENTKGDSKVSITWNGANIVLEDGITFHIDGDYIYVSHIQSKKTSRNLWDVIWEGEEPVESLSNFWGDGDYKAEFIDEQNMPVEEFFSVREGVICWYKATITLEKHPWIYLSNGTDFAFRNGCKLLRLFKES